MVASASAFFPGSPPIPRTRLIGREDERSLARALLLDDAVPLLTLTGPGGIGKTRLALAVAGEMAGHLEDGVVWVDLAPLSEPALVPHTMSHALGITPNTDDAIEAQLAQHLRSRHALLLSGRSRTWLLCCSGRVPRCRSWPPAALHSGFTENMRCRLLLSPCRHQVSRRPPGRVRTTARPCNSSSSGP